MCPPVAPGLLHPGGPDRRTSAGGGPGPRSRPRALASISWRARPRLGPSPARPPSPCRPSAGGRPVFVPHPSAQGGACTAAARPAAPPPPPAPSSRDTSTDAAGVNGGAAAPAARARGKAERRGAARRVAQYSTALRRFRRAGKRRLGSVGIVRTVSVDGASRGSERGWRLGTVSDGPAADGLHGHACNLRCGPWQTAVPQVGRSRPPVLCPAWPETRRLDCLASKQKVRPLPLSLQLPPSHPAPSPSPHPPAAAAASLLQRCRTALMAAASVA
jgi:hypothetical protein